jgi:RNA polymerase sigma factor (sigma-70 family)
VAASPAGDQVLIDQLLNGDPDVVELVRAWIQAAFIPYRQRLEGDREDLEQEILLQVLEALRAGRFGGQSQLRTYVRTFVHHKAVDRLRAARRREWLDVDSLDLPSPSPSALVEMERFERVDIALRVLEEMPEPCRELWRMLQQGLRYQEMSRRLGIAEGTLRARVLRCRQRALEARQRIFSESAVTKPRDRRLGR